MKDLIETRTLGIHCCFWTVSVASPNLHSLCHSDTFGKSEVVNMDESVFQECSGPEVEVTCRWGPSRSLFRRDAS